MTKELNQMTKNQQKSIAVLGLGKFGKSLAAALYEMGADVLIADYREDVVRECAAQATVAVTADLENEEEVNALGLKDMDVVVSAMGSNLAASIMCVAVAKEQGVPLVIAKARTQRVAAILKKVGADRVIDPEAESGRRSARVLMSSSVVDFFEVDGNLEIMEIEPKEDWIGKNLVQLNLRKRFGTNVIAIKQEGEKWHYVDPSQELQEKCRLLVAVQNKDAHLFAHKFNT